VSCLSVAHTYYITYLAFKSRKPPQGYMKMKCCVRLDSGVCPCPEADDNLPSLFIAMIYRSHAINE